MPALLPYTDRLVTTCIYIYAMPLIINMLTTTCVCIIVPKYVHTDTEDFIVSHSCNGQIIKPSSSNSHTAVKPACYQRLTLPTTNLGHRIGIQYLINFHKFSKLSFF